MVNIDLSNRVALVTGASRGLGRAIASDLARAGAHVITLARNQGDLEELDDELRAKGGAATLVPCDLKDYQALDRLGGAIAERWGKLDIFIANAAVLGPISPLGHIDPGHWDDVMAINVTANWRLIRSLDPVLRKSDAGRAIFVSSSVAHIAEARAYWGSYAVSKAALEMLARTYAAETETTAIKTMVVNPGVIRTRMRAVAMPGENPNNLPEAQSQSYKLLPLCDSSWQHSGMLWDLQNEKMLAFQSPLIVEEYEHA